MEQLADRPQGIKPEKARPYHNLIPLTGILSEIFQVGPKSQKVLQAYRTAIEKLGPEFTILDQLDVQQIEAAGIPLLAEAVRRMRAKKDRDPVLDSTVSMALLKIFSSQERAQIRGQRTLFGMPRFQKSSTEDQPAAPHSAPRANARS
ncbi:MAG: endonuclease Q family protein [Desulfobacterales bacterium]|nr:endonuclease Q family protein [Desulfobacterales bacterium]